MRFTKERAIKLHRKMWNLLADNPEWDKSDALIAMGTNEVKITENSEKCFLCAYHDQQYKKKGRNKNSNTCAYCPLLWPSKLSESDCCNRAVRGDSEGLFYMWHHARDMSLEATHGDHALRSRIARVIASLPIRGRTKNGKTN